MTGWLVNNEVAGMCEEVVVT